MAVVPDEPDGVAADRLHPFELEVGADRGRVEDPFAGPLVPAGGARAFAPEVAIGEAVDPVVGPGQFEDLLAWWARMLLGGSVMELGSFGRLDGRSMSSRSSLTRERSATDTAIGDRSWNASSSRPPSVNAVRGRSTGPGRGPGDRPVRPRDDRVRPHDGGHSLAGTGPSCSAGSRRPGLIVVDRPGRGRARGDGTTISRTDE